MAHTDNTVCYLLSVELPYIIIIQYNIDWFIPHIFSKPLLFYSLLLPHLCLALLFCFVFWFQLCQTGYTDSGPLIIMVFTDILKVPYLELPVLITAAQWYERHFKRLPHRVQVVFYHLFEYKDITHEAKCANSCWLKPRRGYGEFTSVLCTSCSVSSSLIRYISKNGSDLLKRSCRNREN